MTHRFRGREVLLVLMLVLLAVVAVAPIWMIVTGAVTGSKEATNSLLPALSGKGKDYAHMGIVPATSTISHLAELLLDTPVFFHMFWNSMKQELFILLGQLLISIPAAWGFARFRFPFRKQLFTLYMILLILPFQVTMVSNYLVIDKMGIMDTMWAVVLPNIFSTFPVFVLSKYMRSIPKALMEAARLDGASEWVLFRRIGVPLAMPGIFAVVVLNFLEYWNNIEQPLVFLRDKTVWPLSLYLPEIDESNVGLSMAASLIALLPAILLFLSGQQFFEEGVVASGLKE